MERIDQEDTSGQAPQPEHESPPSPTPVAAQPAATQRRRKRPLATRKGILLCTLAVLVIGAGVIVGILKLQTPSGRVKWTHHIGNIWKSYPTVSNGIVYIGDSDNTVYALNAASGQVVWSTPLGQETNSPSDITPMPVVSTGIVYANADDCSLYAMDAQTGHILWSYAVAHCARTAPAVGNGIVYIGSEEGVLYALDAVSGRELWSYQQDSSDFVDFLEGSPVLEEGVIYVTSENDVVALDAVSGQKKWVGFAFSITSKYTPAVANGLVYVTSIDGELYALDAHSGDVKWEAHQYGGFTSGPVVVGNTIYVNSYGGVYAFNRADGRERWLFRMPGTLIGLTVVNGMVYAGSADKLILDNQGISFPPDDKLYAIDAISGKEQWFYQLGGNVASTPAVSNGVVYVGPDDGNVYALLPPA